MDYGCCVLHIAREKTKMPNSVGLAVGEHAITVQWCERDPSAADGTTGHPHAVVRLESDPGPSRTAVAHRSAAPLSTPSKEPNSGRAAYTVLQAAFRSPSLPRASQPAGQESTARRAPVELVSTGTASDGGAIRSRKRRGLRATHHRDGAGA